MRYILSLILFFIGQIGLCQSIDNQINNAMNNGKWSEVRELYLTHQNEIEIPVFHPLSKFFIAHFYNQPDSALYYGMELLNKYQAQLGSVSSVVILLAEDLAKSGKYQEATDMLKQYNDAMKTYGVTTPPNLLALENQYRAIAQKGGFKVFRPQETVKIPLRYLKSREDPIMLKVNINLNTYSHDVTYDTGAGRNIMSEELAEKLSLPIYDFSAVDAIGIRQKETKYTIVDTLRLGEIVYVNVPFHVADLGTGHQEADSVLTKIGLDCVIGLQTMFPLNEIQFDFQNGYLVIPAIQSPLPDSAPNMFLSRYNQLITSVFDKGSQKEIDVLLDTGGAKTSLSMNYYKENQRLFADIMPTDTIRMAGLGGVQIAKSISTTWEYSADRVHFVKEPIIIHTEPVSPVTDNWDCLFGLPSFTRYNKVILNFKDMWVQFQMQ